MFAVVNRWMWVCRACPLVTCRPFCLSRSHFGARPVAVRCKTCFVRQYKAREIAPDRRTAGDSGSNVAL
eukprot:1548562-Alexandrium_andersonii.AAC.1